MKSIVPSNLASQSKVKMKAATGEVETGGLMHLGFLGLGYRVKSMIPWIRRGGRGWLLDRRRRWRWLGGWRGDTAPSAVWWRVAVGKDRQQGSTGDRPDEAGLAWRPVAKDEAGGQGVTFWR